MNRCRGKTIDAPNKKDENKNLPGSGNLSDFQTANPNRMGGKTVEIYRNEGSVNIIGYQVALLSHNSELQYN